MTKFAYNNAKNKSIDYTSCKLNNDYYLCKSFEKDTNLYSCLKKADKMIIKL